jgi:hypothetical protein
VTEECGEKKKIKSNLDGFFGITGKSRREETIWETWVSKEDNIKIVLKETGDGGVD